MPTSPNASSRKHPSRRDFLKTSTAAVGAGLAGSLSVGRSAHAAQDETLKVGLIGCGGRGTGAAGNALDADENTKLVAMGDVFGDRLETSRKGLEAKYGDRIAVDPDRCFVGFDAYQNVIDSGVDVVILAEPPHFRPKHLKAAIDAGKHVFCEKPVAVDAPGIRSVLATAEEARKKNLSIVSGLCWRYHHGVKETMQRILDGAIGEIRSIQETYLTGELWYRGRQPDDTEMKFQMRHWYYFTWLSGDFNVEQHVHSLDKALWAFHDEPPIQAWGTGGRQVRTDPAYGNIYDHHAVVYEYPNNVLVHSYCRQQNGCYRDVSDHFVGTKGFADILKHQIDGENEWRFRGEGGNMYVLEHEALFRSIRAAEPVNNGVYMARSTMLAILGRMVDYTGQRITWDEAMNSQEVLAPSSYAWDAEPPILPDENGHYPIAMPGQTKFV
jgi:predicted dehydrogenase